MAVRLRLGYDRGTASESERAGVATFAPSSEETSAAGKLQGKLAVVLGASKSLGRAIAVGYAQEGADVVAVARSASLLDETVAEIESLGRHGLPMVADVQNPGQVRRLAEHVVEEFGRIDVLVHAIGGGLTAAGLDRPRLKEQLQVSGKGVS